MVLLVATTHGWPTIRILFLINLSKPDTMYGSATTEETFIRKGTQMVIKITGKIVPVQPCHIGISAISRWENMMY